MPGKHICFRNVAGDQEGFGERFPHLLKESLPALLGGCIEMQVAHPGKSGCRGTGIHHSYNAQSGHRLRCDPAESLSGQIFGQIGGFRRAVRLRERSGSDVKITSYQILAEAWLAASRTGEWEKSETFTTLLFETCEASLPPMQGLLAGMDRAVAQEACLMLLGKFLMRNKRLKTNAAEGNVDEIARHLRASVKICIGYATRRLARERSKEVAKLCPEIDASNFGRTAHPRLRDVGQLSFEERYSLALAALDLGVQKRLISAKNETIAALVLKEGLTHRQIARKLGISPSAVSQQLSRVSAQLSILKDAVEVIITR